VDEASLDIFCNTMDPPNQNLKKNNRTSTWIFNSCVSLIMIPLYRFCKRVWLLLNVICSYLAYLIFNWSLPWPIFWIPSKLKLYFVKAKDKFDELLKSLLSTFNLSILKFIPSHSSSSLTCSFALVFFFYVVLRNWIISGKSTDENTKHFISSVTLKHLKWNSVDIWNEN